MQTEDIFRDVTAILFDFGGTIEYPGEHLNERFERHLREHVSEVDVRLIDEFALETVRYLYSVPESKTMPYSEVLRFFVTSCAEKMGWGRETWVEDVIQAFIAESAAEVEKNKPVLRRIKEHYRIAVLSNNYGNTEGILRDYGIRDLFEAVYDSTVVGLRKPYVEFFQHGLNDLGWKAEETAYIGDRFERDVPGPKQLGMKTILVVGTLDKPSPDESMVDAKVSCLADLLNLLPRLKG